jgi:hypothetical protein
MNVLGQAYCDRKNQTIIPTESSLEWSHPCEHSQNDEDESQATEHTTNDFYYQRIISLWNIAIRKSRVRRD